jgi:putative SOS response-associated peptidase YedK
MNNFFQKDTDGKRYAISRRGRPFGVRGDMEELVRSADRQMGADIRRRTVPANELVTQIHDRMLAILPNDRFARWLNDEADPRVLLVPFPADQLAVSPQRSAALVGVPSGHGRMAWDQFAPGDTGRAARALETLPIIHKQGRRPIQAAIAIARAAIRP